MKKLLFSQSHRLLPLIFWTFTLQSCSLDIPPMDMFSDPDAITDIPNARSFLASAYRAYPNDELEFSLLGNDFCPTPLSVLNIGLLNLYGWRPKEIKQLASQEWLSYYYVIAQCDALEERLPGVVTEKPAEKDELRSIRIQSKVLEALCYMQLLKIFAPTCDACSDKLGVVIKTRLGVENHQRSTVSDCVKHIEGLLQEALSTSYKTKSKAWLSQTAATYLLADLELYSGQYDKAARHAQQILNSMPTTSEQYEQEYAALWTEVQCPDRIFALQVDVPLYDKIEFGPKDGDFFALNPAFYFSTTDRRYAYAAYPFKVKSDSLQLLGKYNKVMKEKKIAPYLNVFRRAGALYIAAESYARTGNEDKARQLVNGYRAQTGNEPLNDDVKGDALLDSILTDKYKEFTGEGTNFFDLKRTRRRPLPRLSARKGVTIRIAKNDYRWTFPIPKSEYRFNGKAQQNTGWYMIREEDNSSN